MSADRVARGDEEPSCLGALAFLTAAGAAGFLIRQHFVVREHAERLDRLEDRLGIEQLPPSAGEAPEEVGTQER